MLVQSFGTGLIECFSEIEEDGGRCQLYLDVLGICGVLNLLGRP